MTSTAFDWSDLAFGSKKPIRDLRAIFIAAPRAISAARFVQLLKSYLPEGNIVVGIAKEEYIDGFNGQPQFKTLRREAIQPIIDKVNAAKPPHGIVTLEYFQRELPFVVEKLKFKKALFINGSWKHLFHSRPEFYTLVNRHIPYQLISPFTSETEALEYTQQYDVPFEHPRGIFNEIEMLAHADNAAAHSFDYGFQTGVALGKKTGDGYDYITSSFNKVVPYQTYALHYGASRETNFSPMHDLNHYDAIHAEVGLLVAAQKQNLDLADTTVFINLLPCPSCARMFIETDIAEFIYREDHSEGYAIKMLELAGKKVRRVVS